MSKNKIITLTIISIVGVGVFILFINILSNEDVTQVGTEDKVTESEKIVKETFEEVASEVVVEDITPAEKPSVTVENDGVFSAFVEYMVPKGFIDSIRVNVTLDDGVVTDVSIEQEDSNEESSFYQKRFAVEYKEQVVGQKLEDIDLSRVGGASLTTIAFMDAIDEIISLQ